jgi:hypothetical protein
MKRDLDEIEWGLVIFCSIVMVLSCYTLVITYLRGRDVAIPTHHDLMTFNLVGTSPCTKTDHTMGYQPVYQVHLTNSTRKEGGKGFSLYGTCVSGEISPNFTCMAHIYETRSNIIRGHQMYKIILNPKPTFQLLDHLLVIVETCLVFPLVVCFSPILMYYVHWTDLGCENGWTCETF